MYICPHCGESNVLIEEDWSGKWYNCFICGWEKPLEKIPENILRQEAEKLRRREPSSRGIKL